jgi:hypothetical protein
VLSVKPFRHLKAGMVITGSEVYYGRIKDAFEPILTENSILTARRSWAASNARTMWT